jgi:7-carboxy-7-deazaguanine synthase
MSYAVKELFRTLQGEGAQTGRAAVFCRFSGCNLWSGREPDRHSAECRFCDTDFVGVDGTHGGKYSSANGLISKIADVWDGPVDRRFVVMTGGEPLLQLDENLIDAAHREGFEVAVETNGTIDLPIGLDWVCVSPKENTMLRVRAGNELKLVYPQAQAQPEAFADLDFDNFFLQPMDGPRLAANTALAIEYCIGHPQWRLSTQTHKHLGIR